MNEIQKLKKQRKRIIVIGVVVIATWIVAMLYLAIVNGKNTIDDIFLYVTSLVIVPAVFCMPICILVENVDTKIIIEKNMEHIKDEWDILCYQEELQVYRKPTDDKLTQYIIPKVKFYASLKLEDEGYVSIYVALDVEDKKELLKKITPWELHQKYSKTPV